jgi:LCP family protein required for cell wall assembly
VQKSPFWREKPARTVTAAVAALVMLTTTAGYAAVNHYSNEMSHVDAFSSLHSELRPATSPGTTILLVGTDKRTGLTKPDQKLLHLGTGNYGPPRTDSMLLLHLSENQDRVTVMSLPRDSYVDIPSYTDRLGVKHDQRKNKLNAAFELGGAPLTVATVEQATGVRIDHYVEIDFAGFLSMVDALGGVPVCLTKAAVDPLSGLNLPAGESVVNGKQALAYVRARHLDSDFGRMGRQQRFLASIVQKATDTTTLLNPIKLNAFLNAATTSVTTDSGFSHDDIVALGNRLRSINASDILFFTVPIANANYRVDIAKAKNQSTVLWSPAAKDVFARIALDQPVQGSGTPAGEPVPVRVAPAKVRVKVENATNRGGLAKQVADDLAKAGYQLIGKPTNSRSRTATTTVVLYDPGFDQSLKTLMASLPYAKTKSIVGLGNTFILQAGPDYAGFSPVKVSSTALGPATKLASPTKPFTAADTVCS